MAGLNSVNATGAETMETREIPIDQLHVPGPQPVRRYLSSGSANLFSELPMSTLKAISDEAPPCL